MDLLSTIRKTGSRGGVNFSWDDVATSSRRENYLGHSLKAPVGRWQQGKDLNWYARADATAANEDETEQERDERLRKEELRKLKEAEEDAMARALGLPPKQRDTTGANAVDVANKRQIGPAAGTGAAQTQDAAGAGEQDNITDVEAEVVVAAATETTTITIGRCAATGAGAVIGITEIACNEVTRGRVGMGGMSHDFKETRPAVAVGTDADMDGSSNGAVALDQESGDIRIVGGVTGDEFYEQFQPEIALDSLRYPT